MLTQDQLAKAGGVARSTIWLLEGGKEAGMPTLAKLARALGVEPAELMAQPPAYVLKWPRSMPAWDRQVASAAQARARQTAR